MTVSFLEAAGGRAAVEAIVNEFYALVFSEPTLGPVFARAFPGPGEPGRRHPRDWERHLTQQHDFWATVLGGSPAYRGSILTAHRPYGLEERHFAAWLALWHEVVASHLPPEAAGAVQALTARIAGRLQARLAAEAHPTAGTET